MVIHYLHIRRYHNVRNCYFGLVFRTYVSGKGDSMRVSSIYAALEGTVPDQARDALCVPKIWSQGVAVGEDDHFGKSLMLVSDIAIICGATLVSAGEVRFVNKTSLEEPHYLVRHVLKMERPG